jgi:predicted nucleic acid-binding protein
MVVKVVDASAIAALLFGEPAADLIAGRLEDARLVAPTLLAFELANVCLVKSRRHPEQRDSLVAAFGLRKGLGIDEVAVDPAGALALAVETGLTVYDASYLWLARQMRAELVTLDQQLVKAASRALP